MIITITIIQYHDLEYWYTIERYKKHYFFISIITSAVAQLREFQVLAAVFLAETAPKYFGEFLRLDGINKINQCLYTLQYITIHYSNGSWIIYY